MDSITKLLFWVANSLLIPDIILLLILFVRSLILLGSFFNQFMTKRANDALLKSRIEQCDTPGELVALASVVPATDNSLFTRYLRRMLDESQSGNRQDYLLSEFEIKADKDLSTCRILSKIGPVLGLVGTLIAMSPALVGLSSGDVSGMAYNMQVVFATTVVGLLISSIGLVTLVYKQRWYASELNLLEYVSSTFRGNNKPL
ncbi:MotA/TolQ/ExbB proton channel family protein [Porphyromonas pogonae]|uniref:MotA/TolQ/ExbB proton channel family protein n=1 Tax=Porphyromonas pogonae TaxID=867595 RepID=UPI002E77B16B|nr:MotA/TolQ/ExbB proton channel family protein [Porphyromonas pogonae]